MREAFKPIYTEQQLNELRALIAIGHYKPERINDYKRFLLQFIGRRFSGCNCSASSVFHELNAFLINNKLK